MPEEMSADCELRDQWFWQQDVNAATSVAYVAVAIVLVTMVIRGRAPRPTLIIAALVGVEGIGSVMFHGGSGDVSQLVHDLPIIGLVGYMCGWHVGRLVDRHALGTVAGSIGALVLGGAVWIVEPTTVSVVIAVGVPVIAITELIARRTLPPVWTRSIVATAVVAGASWVLGRSNSPLCDPESVWQIHGVWHVLSAVVVLMWSLRVTALTRPGTDTRVLRPILDRVLGLLGWVVVHAFHRTVQIIGRDRIPDHRPVLIVANHGNGFVDPLVVTALLRRLPRFLAKAALWKVVLARPFLALAGVLPVHRRSDGDRTEGNNETFAECTHELSKNATVAIFPEGTTGDRAGLDRVRSGAARIALDAVDVAPGLVIVPIGMAFESRVETRSRTVAIVGEPIDVERWRHANPGDTQAAALTEEIRRSLFAVSPEFASVDEREVMRASARAALADRKRTANFGEVELLARQLAAARPEQRATISEAFRSYASRLQLLGIDDRDLDATRPSLAWLASAAAALFFFSPLAITVALIHLPAIIVVIGTTTAIRSTATKGTVRTLVGLITGLATWIIAGMVLADGVAAVGVGIGVAMLGAATLFVVTPLARLARTLWARFRIRDRAGLLPPVLADRATLVAAVNDAIGTPT